MVERSTAEDVDGAKETLLQEDWLRDVRTDPAGSLRAAISNAMVGLKKAYYGKGPVKAKTYINDNIIFCVLQGGPTRNEETLCRSARTASSASTGFASRRR